MSVWHLLREKTLPNPKVFGLDDGLEYVLDLYGGRGLQVLDLHLNLEDHPICSTHLE